jgi:threonine dehydrogenase-like Zn-dependent dehydrogenase
LLASRSFLQSITWLNLSANRCKGKGKIEVGELPDPQIKEPTDAVVRIVLASVCGSDLWFYRGESPHPDKSIGHEFMGVVEEVGPEVHAIKKGDFVVSPFKYSDGTCVF